MSAPYPIAVLVCSSLIGETGPFIALEYQARVHLGKWGYRGQRSCKVLRRLEQDMEQSNATASKLQLEESSRARMERERRRDAGVSSEDRKKKKKDPSWVPVWTWKEGGVV